MRSTIASISSTQAWCRSMRDSVSSGLFDATVGIANAGNAAALVTSERRDRLDMASLLAVCECTGQAECRSVFFLLSNRSYRAGPGNLHETLSGVSA